MLQKVTMGKRSMKYPLLSKFRHWAAELILVFIGVSAAFWLNNYQQYRHNMHRRDQILTALEVRLRDEIASGKIALAKEEQQLAAYQAALVAGKMPPLHPFVFISNYNPSDVNTLLESEGVLLLDLKTLSALDNLQSVIRWGLAKMARYQKLSDTLIMPNLDQPPSYFYNSATKHLRKQFEIYPQALKARVEFAHELAHAQTVLLKRIEFELHQ